MLKAGIYFGLLAFVFLSCGDGGRSFGKPDDAGVGGSDAGAGGSDGSAASPNDSGAEACPPDGCPGPACGASGCEAQNATAMCVDDRCTIDSCADGFFDCNGLYEDGCEVEGVPELDAPTPLRPFRGAYTGSLHAPASAKVLRPTLAWSELTSSCGSVTYRVEMDDSCRPGALADCAFESPEISSTTTEPSFEPPQDLAVSEEPPVGTLYAWRVQACDGSSRCSPWSEVAYLHVGRTEHDLNGDGYADIAMSTVGANTASDRWLDVYYGGSQPNGARDARMVVALSSPRYAGDLNADGFADLVGTVDSYAACASGSGGLNLRVLWGGAQLEEPRIFDLCSTAGSPSVTHFPGHVGDLDGDGFADLGNTRSFGTDNNFRVHPGGEEVGGVPILDVEGFELSYTFVGPKGFAGGGDFDGDGWADVVVLENENAQGGTVRVHLVRGASTLGTAFDESGQIAECQSAVWVALAGDWNGDDLDDWAVVCAGGSTYYFGLTYGGRPIEFVEPLATSVRLSSASGAMDFDADGTAEFFLGTAPDNGEAIIWRPGSSDPAALERFAMVSASARLQVADHNGDGRPDLAFSASSQTQGATVLWLGASTSFNLTPLRINAGNDVEYFYGVVF